MPRYQCPSCGTSFEAEGKARCPRCLRQHGLEPLPAEQPRPPRSRAALRRLIVLGVLLLSLVALTAGGLLLWRRWRVDLPRPGELAVLDTSLLRRTLIARGVPPEHAGSPFASSPALRRLAEGASGEPAARARELARRLSGKLSAARADLEASAQAPVLDAAPLLDALEKKQPVAVRSLEAALLMSALCREAGLPAVVASVRRLEAPVATPAIAPGVGRYLAVVYAPGKLGRDPLALLDPLRALPLPGWAGGGGDAEMAARVDGFTPLDDGSAAAHLLALRAFALRDRDPRTAYLLSERALRAAAPAGELHLLRAGVLAAAGGTEDALVEVERALKVADEPSGRVALARLRAEAGRLKDALELLQRAVGEDAEYWPARVLLAGLEGALDPKRAEPHLEVARRVAPEEPAVLVAQAAILLGKGEAGPALDLLRRATARRPTMGNLLLLYQALLLTRATDEAAKVRARLLREVPAVDRPALERTLVALDDATRMAEQPASAPAAPPSTPRLKGLRLPDVRLGR